MVPNVEIMVVNDSGNPLPARGTEHAAGYDVFSAEEEVVIPAFGWKGISTGLRIVTPEEYYIEIRPRSGLAMKYGIDCLAGTIDNDYRGILNVILLNNGRNAVTIKKGERIAQLVLRPMYSISWKNISEDQLTKTVRGEGGFGSTGK